MLSDKVIEESAQGIAFVVAEHRLAVQPLAHLFDKHGGKHPFECLAGRVRRGPLTIGPLRAPRRRSR